MRWCTGIVIVTLYLGLSACTNFPSNISRGQRVRYQPDASEQSIDSSVLYAQLEAAEALQNKLHQRAVQTCYPSLMDSVDRDLSEAKQDMAIHFYHDAAVQMKRLQERQKWLQQQTKGRSMARRCPTKAGAYLKEVFSYDQ
jgi:hypothetical protein